MYHTLVGLVSDATPIVFTLTAWILPFLMIGTLPITLFCRNDGSTVCIATLYVLVKCMTNNMHYTAPFETLKQRFQEGFRRYFQLTPLTASVIVRVRDWKSPQVIMTGPHGCFNMGGMRSVITTDGLDKNIVCALAPAMSYAFFEAIVRLAGLQGMIPLRHSSICAEMLRSSRDLMVIPGGFVETNTGNEKFSTMYDGTWEYWVMMCMRHGYDVSFQWIHGASQTYHTGTAWMDVRKKFGKYGIPCMWPHGKYGTLLPRNDVPFTVAAFRMTVPHLPQCTRSDPTVQSTLAHFRQRVQQLLSEYPPCALKNQSPVTHISRL